MFTVKRITTRGNEALYEADSVAYVPSHGDNPPDVSTGSVALSGPSGHGTYTIDTGTVYIMNESGATVSKYELGGVSPEDYGSINNSNVMNSALQGANVGRVAYPNETLATAVKR